MIVSFDIDKCMQHSVQMAKCYSTTNRSISNLHKRMNKQTKTKRLDEVQLHRTSVYASIENIFKV